MIAKGGAQCLSRMHLAARCTASTGHCCSNATTTLPEQRSSVDCQPGPPSKHPRSTTLLRPAPRKREGPASRFS
eukprot:9272607-Alexandrium_andersonii.AAC.1